MARCYNCGRETLRTKDWACQWCGHPLLFGPFKKIDKTYRQLKEERFGKSEKIQDSVRELETEMKSEEEKIARLDFIRNYENPGEGSFYDNISSADAMHVISETDDAIDYLWENNGFSRKRLSTQLFQFSPVLEYNELDPNTDYLIRVTGYGEALRRR